MRVALASCDPYPAVLDDEGPLRDALVARGVEVVSPAWDADFAWHEVNAVLLRTTWDYHVRAAEFLAWCRRVATQVRLFNSADVVAWNIDKRYLRELCARGVAIAPTTWVTSPDELGALPAHGIIKPIIGANAFATLRYDCAPDAARRLVLDQLARHPTLGGFMVQPYLASVEREGELSAIVIDGRCVTGIRKVPADGDFRVQEDWGAKDEPYLLSAAERAHAEQVVGIASAIVGDLLYARVDYLRDSDGRLVVNELELVEPSLFFRHGGPTADALAAGLVQRMRI